MDVYGKVISVDLNIEIQKKDGGTYPGSRLTFRGQDGKVQEQALHANVLKFNPSIKTALSNLNPGDDVVVVKEKKGDFWNVVSIKRADANQSSDGGSSVGSTSKQSTATPVPRSNYETPEERAQRQVLIVRQSSLSAAVSVLTVGAKTPPKTEEVLQLANQFVDYVFNKEPEYVDDIASDDIEID